MVHLLLLPDSIQNWKPCTHGHERGTKTMPRRRSPTIAANLVSIFQHVGDICDLKITLLDSPATPATLMGPDRAICMRAVCRSNRSTGRAAIVQGGKASARKVAQIPTNTSANANVLSIGRLSESIIKCVSATFPLANIRHSRVRVNETLNVGLPHPLPSFPFRGDRAHIGFKGGLYYRGKKFKI